MRTSSIDSDDEDECLPTSTNCNEDLIDLPKNNTKLKKKNSEEIIKKDLKANETKTKITNKRKCLGSSSFLIKTDGFLKSKKRSRLEKTDKSQNIKLFDNISDNKSNKKENSLDATGKFDAVKENNFKIKKKYNISYDILIKKTCIKSLQISYKRDNKDPEISSISTNQGDEIPSKKLKLCHSKSNDSFDKTEIHQTLKDKSILKNRSQSDQNLFKITSEKTEENYKSTTEKKENLNLLNDRTVTISKNKSNQELWERIALKRNSIDQKSVYGKKEILNNLYENTGLKEKNSRVYLKLVKFGLKLNSNKIIEKKNSEQTEAVNKEQKENYLGKKPSLSLTKLKRTASNSDSIRSSKRIKENNLNSGNNNPKNNFNDMSVYDRRTTVFGMDNIGERTNISNGVLSRISNDDNSSNNQYYSSSSNLNGQQQQQQSTTIATLCNIGNTCYLNSVVYTLRFAPLFLHNLHHLVDDLSSVNQNIVKYRAKSSSLGRNVSGLHIENARSWSSKDLASLESNSILTGGSGIGGIGLGSSIGNFGSSNTTTICDNQKSSQQIATEKLHELYQHLHRNEMNDSTEPFHADTFLHAIQAVSAIFEGNQQQDAHEFLMCVLDNIRETCQSLTKAITEYPDVISNGYVGIPEQTSESRTSAATVANINVVALPKEQLSSQISNVSNTTNLIKTSFFSRKSKRKDEAKSSKNLKIQSKELKDNTTASSNFSVSSDSTDAANSNSAFPNSLLGTSILENDISGSGNSGKNNSSPTIASQKDNNKEHLAEKIKKLGLDFFSQYFEGITVSTTKCLSCETITEQKETMIDIAVPISENADCSGSFIANSCITREYFRGENKYRCEQCTGYTEAIRSISYEVLPRLLIIQLSRFSGGMEKINSYLPTPFTLQCFCSQCCKASDNEKLHIYKLYSVITHVGATMSVGHYIAYTCSLDWSNEYINCPKDRRRHQQQQQIQQQQQQNKLQNLSSSNKTSFGSNTNNSHVNLSNGNSSSGTEKNMGLVKKLIYGRSKASSSGDMTKNMKNLNGISSSTKDITNGVEKLKMGPTLCQGLNCCGIKLRQNNLNYSSNSLNNIGSSTGLGSINPSSTASASNLNGSYVDLIDDINTNINSNVNSGHSGYSSMNGSRNYHHRQQHQHQNEPIWYMCDDDKIKAMTQREFEELLSPNRKIMITPYLLFYARKSLNNSDSTNDINSDCRNGSDE